MTLTFTLTPPKENDQFRDDPPNAAEFCEVLGRMIVAWSRLERAMDIVASSSRTIDSTHPISGDPDYGFKRKIRAIRRALKGHAPYAKSQKWIGHLLSTIKVTSGTRNLLIHGMCEGFVSSNPVKIKFASSRYCPGGVRRQKATFSLADLKGVLSDIQRLDGELGLLTLSVVCAPRRPAVGLDR